MALFDDASLVVTPNGYKEGTLYSIKPTSGAGDMTVVRATTATRVNSAGLIELVPYNLAEQSNSFSTSPWTRAAGSGGTLPTLTANYGTAPDGTQNAWRIQLLRANNSNSYSQVNQYPVTVISGQQYTWSVYLKSLSGTPTISIIGDFGRPPVTLTSEWVRYTGTGTATASQTQLEIAILGSTYATGNSLSADFLAYGYQLNEGTLKDYLRTETRLNIPRLDYSNGTCPSLLVEPQRTNVLTYSEDFSNISWSKISCSYASNIVTASIGTTLKGLNKPEATQGEQCAYYDVEYINHRWLQILTGSSGADIGFVNYDIQNKVVGTQSGGYTGSIEDFGTFIRIKIKFTTTLKVGLVLIFVDSGTAPRADDTTSTGSFKLYRSQNEVGSYPTSYIPTTSAAVTRNADEIYKTGISSLIGQTEGTVYFEIDKESLQDGSRYMFVSDASFSNRIVIYQASSGINVYCSAGATFNFVFNPPSGNLKVAVGYKSGLYTFFVNGIERATSNISAVPTGLNTTGLGVNEGTLGADAPSVSYKAAALFPTRLTNAELASLTTI